MSVRQDKSKVIDRLRRALDEIPQLRQQSSDSPDFEKWKRNTEIAIENSFGRESRHVKEFTGISYFPSILITGMDPSYQKYYLSGLQSASVVLESMIDEVEEYWHDNEVSASSPDDRAVASNTREVFLIHGRDEGTRETVARFLRQLELEPVILAEQASRGRTIIEKFERHADASFAIALLTPDDAGSLGSETDDPRPRARQNVVFELGYFIGRLGRAGVCALTKGEVDIPSDYSGVVYISLDDGGGWKLQLVKELKTAGFDVDANRAL